MNAEEIRQMRDLLAAQPAVSDTRASGLRGKLTSLLARKPPPSATMDRPCGLTTPDRLDLNQVAVDSNPGDPVPRELLLGDLAPRRTAFGQRAEGVLELDAPMPAAPRRLILCAAGGAAVGEIILRAGGAGLHAEQAPFFPEDLADEAFPRPKIQPDTIRPEAIKQEPAVTQAAQPPAPLPELAASFLLANLAARLASEEAALNHRRAAAQTLSEAA